MRILYLASVRIPSEKASGLAIMRQCEAFVALGHQVTLVYPARKNTVTEDAFSYYGIESSFSLVSASVFPLFISLGLFGYALMRITLFWSLTWFLWHNRNKTDLLYARDPWLLLFPLLFFPKKKMIVEMHSKHSNWVTRLVVASAGTCVVISEGLRVFYGSLTKRSDIIVEPSGVELAQFKNMPAVSSVRSELSLPHKAVIFGYVGKYTTMGEEKGVRELIEGFGALYAVSKNAHLLLVGIEQAEYAHVRDTCSRVGIPTDAYTLRALDTKVFASYLHACDVLLMNYPDTEHYSLYMSPSKLFAYLGSGKLIITSDLPSIRTCIDKTDAVFFTPGDSAELFDVYQKALRIVEEGELRKAPEKVSHYTWYNRGKRILERVHPT
jgi:glycosyltransferase involved in cell wall biosynthesis